MSQLTTQQIKEILSDVISLDDPRLLVFVADERKVFNQL